MSFEGWPKPEEDGTCLYVTHTLPGTEGTDDDNDQTGLEQLQSLWSVNNLLKELIIVIIIPALVKTVDIWQQG